MSYSIYDTAVANKFKKVFKNTIHAPVHSVMEENAKLNNAKILLPMLSVWRVSSPVNLSRYSHPMHRQGRVRLRDLATLREEMLRTIPVDLRYNLEVWSTKRSQMDDLVRELIFYIMDDPIIEVVVPQSQLELKFVLKIDDGPIDNSDLEDFEDQGPIYRSTFELLVEAELFAVRENSLVKEDGIIVDMDVLEPNPGDSD